MYIYAVQTTEPIIAGKAPDPGRPADGRTGQKKFDLANPGAHNTTITQVKSHSGATPIQLAERKKAFSAEPQGSEGPEMQMEAERLILLFIYSGSTGYGILRP
ncbi:hypothetical protein MGG_16138 [Pyricularia oryzae 70-15]|uniref:Uncharacterized protein n=1 Tax=Pyricularia oryzae (strain 70-15 / ATCC MYA-4617 / FGSC 8958) TaxID=242507 RepID=G4MKA0_PYRO7|nr:uncharacterized protein MGG_16138 [Pyricularia oryzae 70-15]EHA56691.1 hypothetical protein MGG_16138 [Pyricularia oryzae 70-15]